MKLKEILSVVFYTNENYFPIAELAISEFNKFSKNINIEKYLFTNNVKENYDILTTKHIVLFTISIYICKNKN
jgi:hypothetical protein